MTHSMRHTVNEPVAHTLYDSMVMLVTGHQTIHSSHLRTVQVCGEHNDGVCQHVGSVCTGKQSLSAKEDI